MVHFVKQTKLYNPPDAPGGLKHGNCQRAAIACLLDLAIDDIPPFEEAKTTAEFWEQVEEWLFDRRLQIKYYLPHKPPDGYSIACGKSSRGVNHAVIALDGNVIWDTHPSDEGLLSIIRYEAIVPIE